MKTITIITDQITDRALAAALPAAGIASVAIRRGGAARPEAAAIRSYRNPARFAPRFRIDVVVEDAAVETVFDAIDLAYGAGVFSDAEAWVEARALAPAA